MLVEVTPEDAQHLGQDHQGEQSPAQNSRRHPLGAQEKKHQH